MYPDIAKYCGAIIDEKGELALLPERTMTPPYECAKPDARCTGCPCIPRPAESSMHS